MKIAVAGFRHYHIVTLYKHAQQLDGVSIVAACEEDQAARDAILADESAGVELTHADIDSMLAEADCDTVAIGDYYTKRGAIAIKALKAGKHVIGDKPLCTSLEELDEIEKLSREKGLRVGCMLDLRDLPPYMGLKQVIGSGEIGDVHAVNFGGQHPLNLAGRPGWYFEPGKHGGTITDIAIHAFDILPWITGKKITRVNSARCWNAFAPDFPHFKDAAQVMLTMENGGGILGDVSYFMPDSQGYSNNLYWRMSFFGTKGIAETSCNAKSVTIIKNGEEAAREIALPEANTAGYLKAFMADVAGSPIPDTLTTDGVMECMRKVLTAQKAGDENLHDVQI